MTNPPVFDDFLDALEIADKALDRLERADVRYRHAAAALSAVAAQIDAVRANGGTFGDDLDTRTAERDVKRMVRDMAKRKREISK